MLGSVAAGVGLGIAARVLMRVIALEAGLPGAYSFGGSFEVVLFGLIVGAPIALAFRLVRPRIPLRRPFAGLALGTVMTVVLALLPPASARSALQGTPDTPVLTFAGFWLLFTLWGIAVDGYRVAPRPDGVIRGYRM